MKLKSLAMLATSALLAGSVAYIAPALADYNNTVSPSAQANQSVNNNNAPNLNDPNTNFGALPPDSNYHNNPNTNSADNTAANPEQQYTPDTATGDDDY